MTDRPAPLRVVLAEDGDLLRAGVLALLGGFDEIEVVGVATDLPSLLGAVDEHAPDVVLTDIRMPPTLTDEGIRAADQLRATHPGVGVVVLTQYADAEYAVELVSGGSEGRGYLLKERVADAGELVGALHAVAAGGSVIDPVVVAPLIRDGARHAASPLAQLTARELEVLGLVAEGHTNQAIATQLFVTDRAVEKHVSSIFAKLGLLADAAVHRRVAATLLYLTEGTVASRS